MSGETLILLVSNHWLEKKIANPTNAQLSKGNEIVMLFSVATTFEKSCYKNNGME